MWFLLGFLVGGFVGANVDPIKDTGVWVNQNYICSQLIEPTNMFPDLEIKSLWGWLSCKQK